MRKYGVLLYKDLLLLIRDKTGLLFLFIMPMILVLIMTGIQEGAVESASKKSVSVIVLDKDGEEVGHTIIDELMTQDIFNVHIADSRQNESNVKKKVRDGEYLIGVFISEGTSAILRKSIETSLSEMIGVGDLDSLQTLASIKVLFDPTVNGAFRTSVLCYIREASYQIEKKILLSTLSEAAKAISPLPIDNTPVFEIGPISIEESTFSKKSFNESINVTEHNVPAWTLFAIFFIVISLSDSILLERKDGSFDRLMCMQCSYFQYIISKTVVFEMVCVLQFILILMMGKLLFPLVGLPVFSMHGSFFYCMTIVLFCAFAAIGTGLIIGTFASTHQQASIFGAVFVVVMSAIGGIWVPTFMMPSFLNKVSIFSPLNWGIEAFYDIILRDGDISSILFECMLLSILGIMCIVVLIFYFRKNRAKKTKIER